jgi:transcriptional regulator GlxA family with amidase domain
MSLAQAGVMKTVALLDTTALRDMSSASAYRVVALADRLGVTPRHLRRLFMRQLGCTPERWLHEERLQRALLLLPSAPSVKAVACALAFGNASHFCRDFRVRFGYTPSELTHKRQLGGPC